MSTVTKTRNLHDLSHELAEQAFRAYMRNISPVLYLYGFTVNGIYTELSATPDKPRYFQLVICEHIPRNLPVDALSAWFYSRLRREPLYTGDVLPTVA